VRDSDQEYAL
jgi:DNA mismatch repair ATPase MutS